MSNRNIPHSGKLQNLWDNDLKWEAPIEKTSPVFRHSKHSKHLIARGSVYSTYFTTETHGDFHPSSGWTHREFLFKAPWAAHAWRRKLLSINWFKYTPKSQGKGMFLGVISPRRRSRSDEERGPGKPTVAMETMAGFDFLPCRHGFFFIATWKKISESLYWSKFSPWHCGWASEILHQAGYLLGFLERFFVNHGILMGCLPSINNQLVQDFLQLQAWASCLSCLARRFLRASPGDDEILYWRQYGYLTNDPWKSINKLKKKFQHTHIYILKLYIYIY